MKIVIPTIEDKVWNLLVDYGMNEKAADRCTKELLVLCNAVWKGEQLPCDCNVKLAETTLQIYCPKCYKTHKMKQ